MATPDDVENVKDVAMTESTHSTSNKKKKAQPQLASFGETMSFVWNCGPKVRLLVFIGTLGGMANGCVYPILAYLFSSAFADISSAESEGLKQVRELAYTFMIVGTYALVAATIQGWCFEICAYHGSQAFRLAWFRALLRQDPAFFDVRDVGGLAAQIGPNATKYRRGVGRKFGEGIQFFTTGVGGLAFAFFFIVASGIGDFGHYSICRRVGLCHSVLQSKQGTIGRGLVQVGRKCGLLFRVGHSHRLVPQCDSIHGGTLP
mmetsp:Transcript_19432/g.45977  ORF Transcript_19432/g.45977 Transcript_19432/m.45977 type:complete len:261 (+) Transcript_19432:223-1005(+)